MKVADFCVFALFFVWYIPDNVFFQSKKKKNFGTYPSFQICFALAPVLSPPIYGTLRTFLFFSLILCIKVFTEFVVEQPSEIKEDHKIDLSQLFIFILSSTL